MSVPTPTLAARTTCPGGFTTPNATGYSGAGLSMSSTASPTVPVTPRRTFFAGEIDLGDEATPVPLVDTAVGPWVDTQYHGPSVGSNMPLMPPYGPFPGLPQAVPNTRATDVHDMAGQPLLSPEVQRDTYMGPWVDTNLHLMPPSGLLPGLLHQSASNIRPADAYSTVSQPPVSSEAHGDSMTLLPHAPRQSAVQQSASTQGIMTFPEFAEFLECFSHMSAHGLERVSQRLLDEVQQLRRENATERALRFIRIIGAAARYARSGRSLDGGQQND